MTIERHEVDRGAALMADLEPRRCWLVQLPFGERMIVLDKKQGEGAFRGLIPGWFVPNTECRDAR